MRLIGLGFRGASRRTGVAVQGKDSDEAENGEVGEEKRGERGSTGGHVFEETAGEAVKVGPGVKDKAESPDEELQEQDGGAKAPELGAFIKQKENKEKANGGGAAEDGNPFGPMEEAVGGVIADAEDEVSGEASQGEEKDPLSPFFGSFLDHAVHEQEATEADVGERCCERSGIGEASQRALVEEAAFKMVEHASGTHQNRSPTDKKAKKSRDSGHAISGVRGEAGEQEESGGEREPERNVLGGIPEVIFGMSEENVAGQA